VRAVNLLPREVTKTKDRAISAPAATAVVAGVVVLTVLAGGFVRESAGVAHKRSELDAARAELALIPPPAQQESSTAALAGEHSKRVTALQGALNGRVAWDRVLREISLVLPDDVWLSAMTLQSPAASAEAAVAGMTAQPAAAATAPTDFTMNGNARTHAGVARRLSRLAVIPELDGVTLGHSAKTMIGKRTAVEFTVSASVRAPGATP